MSSLFEPPFRFAPASNSAPESEAPKIDETPAVWPPPPTLAPPVAPVETPELPEPQFLTRSAPLDAVFGFALGAVVLGFLAACLFSLPPTLLRGLHFSFLLIPFLVGSSVVFGGAGIVAYRYFHRRWPIFADGGLVAILIGLLAFNAFFLMDALSR